MNYVKLSDADRQRFDCKEWLPVELADASITDVEELSDRFGFDPIDDWPEAMRGTISLEDAGQGEDKRKRPKWYMRALVWMALHQNGHDVSWDDAGLVQFLRLDFKSDDPVEPGKGEADGSPSETSDASTTPPSPSSSD